jgi:hypothetical protein
VFLGLCTLVEIFFILVCYFDLGGWRNAGAVLSVLGGFVWLVAAVACCAEIGEFIDPTDAIERELRECARVRFGGAVP